MLTHRQKYDIYLSDLKLLCMKNLKFASLAFFAAHYNLPLEKLSWGVIKKVVSGREAFVPAVLIKGSNLAVDICRGQFISKACFEAHQISFLKADAKQNKNQTLCFFPRDKHADELLVTEEDLRQIYQYRWYSPELENKLVL